MLAPVPPGGCPTVYGVASGVGVAVGAGVGVGGGVGCGVGEGVGPVDSTRFTCELRSTSVPAPGSLRMTVPASCADGSLST